MEYAKGLKGNEQTRQQNTGLLLSSAAVRHMRSRCVTDWYSGKGRPFCTVSTRSSAAHGTASGQRTVGLPFRTGATPRNGALRPGDTVACARMRIDGSTHQTSRLFSTASAETQREDTTRWNSNTQNNGRCPLKRPPCGEIAPTCTQPNPRAISVAPVSTNEHKLTNLTAIYPTANLTRITRHNENHTRVVAAMASRPAATPTKTNVASYRGAASMMMATS